MERSILLIEDNEQNRYLVTFLLEQHGYRVHAAPDGPRGIEAARAHHPELILLDIQLPTMDGYSVARALRAERGLQNVPIVAVTSHAMTGDREKAIAAGCTGYIEKPIDPDTFVSEIERVLPERQSMRVLVVDDREDGAEYLRALLTSQGCEVEVARHGAEALMKARAQVPTLVISDLLMPVMDGYTLLRHWKTDERLCHVPFVVYTATYTDPDDERLAKSLGADAFILKPAAPDAFLARIREVRRSGEPALPLAPPAPTEDETGILREYSEVLIRKLEEKTLELEETNRRLERDIEARERAEAALRESEERLRQVAENVEDVFWLHEVAKPQRTVYVSPKYESVFGRSPESLYADWRSWLEATHPDDRPRLNRILATHPEGGWEETYRIVRPDGSERWLRARAYPVRDAEGRVHRVAGVARDVTDFRRLEEQFLQAQKMEAVGQLAGGVAHDFNNILSVILSYASLVLRELEPTSPLKPDIEEIRRAGERAAELTRQLLAYSRQQVREPKVLPLDDVLGTMDRLLRRLLGEDVQLAIQAASGGACVCADPAQLEQVVMNLAVNARDAMPSGGTLTLRTEPRVLDAAAASRLGNLRPGPHVVLRVSDTGQGMDAETRARIFEPFFTTKEKGKGTGLGLATVLAIVEQSHGHIAVTSAPGQGTTFEVYLPVAPATSEQARSSLPPASLRGSETILVVEDDEFVREATRSILRRYGYRVLATSNGHEAIALLEAVETKIALLLTDVVMPRMNGYELAEHVRRLRPGIRVVYVSGYGKEGDAASGGLPAGAVLLHKPVTPDTLLQKVRAALDVPTEASSALRR